MTLFDVMADAIILRQCQPHPFYLNEQCIFCLPSIFIFIPPQFCIPSDLCFPFNCSAANPGPSEASKSLQRHNFSSAPVPIVTELGKGVFHGLSLQ